MTSFHPLCPQAETVLSCLSSPGSQSVPQPLEAAVKTLQLPVDMASPEERLAATSLALFLARYREFKAI